MPWEVIVNSSRGRRDMRPVKVVPRYMGGCCTTGKCQHMGSLCSIERETSGGNICGVEHFR